MMEEKQKISRRDKYAKKVKRSVAVMIDESKKVKVEVAIDRGKNPKKYNFLGQKALNEFQIYGQFQDFELNNNPKQLGIEYLRQLPKINEGASRVKKSRSTNTLIEVDNHHKSRYVDYLQDLKTQRSTRTSKTDQQIEGFLQNHKKK